MSWDSDGSVLAVCLERSGRGWRVAGRVRGAGGALEKQLVDAVAALKRSSETVVVLGGNPDDTSVCDVVMPNLSADDLASALRLELPRFTPLPPDRLRFGYRIVGRAPDAKSVIVRLVFAPTEKWERWLAAASAIEGGVDALLPASAGLDPVLAEVPVATAAPNGGLIQVARTTSDGCREWDLSHVDDCTGVFGVGEQPLKLDGLDLGALAADSADEQRAFAPAVILAMYALDGRVAADAQTLPAMPAGMRPRRNTFLKTLALVAAIYVVGATALVVAKRVQANRQTADARERAHALLMDQIDRLQRRAVDPKPSRALLSELDSRLASRALPTQALAAINAGIDDRMWCHNFLWSDGGKVMLTMVSSTEGEGMTDGLKSSTLISGFGEDRRVRPDRSVAYQISFTMRPMSEIADLPSPAVQWTPSDEQAKAKPEKPVIHGVPVSPAQNTPQPAPRADTTVNDDASEGQPTPGKPPETTATPPPVVPPEATVVPETPPVIATEPDTASAPESRVERPGVVRPTTPDVAPPPLTAPGIVRPALEE